MQTRAGGTGPRNPVSPKPFEVPQCWWEWWASLYDTDRYTLEAQQYGCTIQPQAGAGASTQGNTNTIQVPETFYCFGVESRGVQAANGQLWTVPYRIGFKVANGNDWFNGQWIASVVTGDAGAQITTPRHWEWPKQLNTNEIVTVTIDNSLPSSVALVIDVCLVGYLVRELRQPIERVG